MKEIKISEVLALLDAGKSREEIAEHYGISMADCKRLFNHPSLKGKKAKKQPAFTIVDDTAEATEEVSNPVVEETEEEVIEDPQMDVAAEVASIQEEEASNWDN